MKKGTKIIFIIVGILILIGLAYYFLIYKPSKAGERGSSNGSGTNNSGGGSTTTTSGCVPYTQAQQDADWQKCRQVCMTKGTFSQVGCLMACNTNKKPVKTC